MKYSLIIWDFNGTILDDLELSLNSINIVLKRRNLPIIKDKAAYRTKFGFPIENYYRSLGMDFEKEPYKIPADEWVKLYNDGRKVAWSATQSATATVYDNVVWREDAHLPLVKKGDRYYCIVYDGNPVILSGTATEMTAMRELTGVYWTSSQGGMYMRSWSGFAAYGDALIFNTSSALYFYQPETNMPTRIAELSASLGGLQIFGIVDVTDGVVTYVAAADYQGEFELRTYTIA
jgi:hypothetical protein